MRFLAISRCFKKNQMNQEYITTFHFRGYYCGSCIKSIKVLTQKNIFVLGMDYILTLDSVKIENKNLWCTLFKYQKLF
ncbi:MAG: hypothetical protein A2417_17705 [Bdellovibrionales bacterium RIFOXYC1_FULL_37_79]|nr:MAG: hypothetical protein A2417_17705 [Bdellovibrionales bacterium RIFOXYC1_FULL_37_79]